MADSNEIGKNVRSDAPTQVDVNLRGNEKIEAALAAFQKNATEESLTNLLSILRHRMQENGQLIVSVETTTDGTLQLKAREIKGKGKWFVAFTSMEEQILGPDKVMSTFQADIGQLFAMARQTDEIQGIALNPWHNAMLLNKQLLQIVSGE